MEGRGEARRREGRGKGKGGEGRGKRSLAPALPPPPKYFTLEPPLLGSDVKDTARLHATFGKTRPHLRQT